MKVFLLYAEYDCHVVTPSNLLFASRLASGWARVLPTLGSKFSFISFHHFAPWIKKQEPLSCILKMLILLFPFLAFYFWFLSYPIAELLLFMENGNEIRYLLMMMRLDEVIFIQHSSLSPLRSMELVSFITTQTRSSHPPGLRQQSLSVRNWNCSCYARQFLFNFPFFCAHKLKPVIDRQHEESQLAIPQEDGLGLFNILLFLCLRDPFAIVDC